MKTRHTLLLTTTFLLMISLIAGCNPTGSEEELHDEPFGLVLLTGGVTLAEQRDGVVTYASGSSLSVPAGDETPLITLRFLDEDGDRFTPDEPEYELDWAIGNSDVLGVHQHEEEGKWNFHLEGEQAGTTSIRFFLMHDGHSDFESLNFNVTVE